MENTQTSTWVDISDRKFQFIARLWHINGGTSDITMELPWLGSCGDIYEKAHAFIKGYILNLTRYYIQISRFQIIQLSVNIETGEKIKYHRDPIDIPEGKIFEGNMDFGRWVTPEQAGLSSGYTAVAEPEIIIR